MGSEVVHLNRVTGDKVRKEPVRCECHSRARAGYSERKGDVVGSGVDDRWEPGCIKGVGEPPVRCDGHERLAQLAWTQGYTSDDSLGFRIDDLHRAFTYFLRPRPNLGNHVKLATRRNRNSQRECSRWAHGDAVDGGVPGSVDYTQHAAAGLKGRYVRVDAIGGDEQPRSGGCRRRWWP